MVKTTLLIVFFLLILVVAKQSAAQPSELDLGECSRHLKAYLDAVITGDLESARTYWRPPDLEAASRLGLSYHGPWLKVDSDSPIWSFVEHLRRDDVHYTAMPPQEFAGGPLDGVVNIRLTFDQQGQRTTFRYYFDRIDETWLLASPVRLVCEQGPSVPTHWVTVYDRRFAMSATLPPRLIALLDSCVAVVADQLAFTPEQLALLERERLGYLLAGPEWVEQLAGAPTVGVANLQQDVVVTSHPCHAHELAHLLVNFWLGELPLYTLPLLQEGIATHLGGRWGRHPRVLHRVGHTTLTDGLLTLDELLTYNQFHGQSADLTYPPAGVFAGFVLERYGPDGLRRAYQSVSGTWEEVSSWNAAVVKARLSAALGVSWTTLADEFSTFVAEPARAGGTPCDIMGGIHLYAGVLQALMGRNATGNTTFRFLDDGATVNGLVTESVSATSAVVTWTTPGDADSSVAWGTAEGSCPVGYHRTGGRKQHSAA